MVISSVPPPVLPLLEEYQRIVDAVLTRSREATLHMSRVTMSQARCRWGTVSHLNAMRRYDHSVAVLERTRELIETSRSNLESSRSILNCRRVRLFVLHSEIADGAVGLSHGRTAGSGMAG